MVRIIPLILSICLYSTTLSAQIHLNEQAQLTITEGGLLKVNGSLDIQTNSELTMYGNSIQIEGNLIQNGSLNHTNGSIMFVGTGIQSILGNLSDGNAFHQLNIKQQAVSDQVILQADIEIKEKLEFTQGKITTNTQEVYLKNEAADALVGARVPDKDAGNYAANDRYIEGNFSRQVNANQNAAYLFPIGNTTDNYNPLILENIIGGSGKIMAYYQTENIGTITTNTTIDCSNTTAYTGTATSVVAANNLETPIIANNMTGEGFWELESTTSLTYDLIAYPNMLNQNNNGSTNNNYRLLKRPNGEEVGTDWSASLPSSNACLVSNNYHEVIGTDFTGFSKFAIASFCNSADADMDGVVDCVDQCPNGDDRIDLNDNQIPDDCECAGTDLILNDDLIIEKTYVTNTSIYSNGKIVDGATVDFKAGVSIQLNPGFHAAFGSQFSARITACSIALIDTISSEIKSSINSSSLNVPQAVNSLPSLEVYPNPMRTESVLAINLPVASPVKLDLYDLNGRYINTLVNDENLSAGFHHYQWYCTQIPVGMYGLMLNGRTVAKIVVIK